MKKVLVTLLLCMLMVSLVGCKTTVDTTNHKILYDKFVVIETHKDIQRTLYIVYDKDTMVEYFITSSQYQGGICPIYDENGNVKIYPESLTND